MTIPVTPTALTAAGLLVLLVGVYFVYQIREALKTGTIKEAWDKLAVLIGVFILGYLAFLTQLITSIKILDSQIIAAGVFLAGAVFVAAVAYFNYDAMT